MSGERSSTPAGAALLGECVPKTTETIRAWLANTKRKGAVRNFPAVRLSMLPPEIAALLILRHVLDRVGLESRPGYTGLCRSLGALLRDEIDLRERAKADKELKGHFVKIKKSKRSFREKRTRLRVRANLTAANSTMTADVQLGMQALQLCIEATGVVAVETYTALTMAKAGKVRLRNRVVPSPELEKWFTDFNESSAILRPVYLPLSEPPRPWTSAHGGGYGSEAGRGGALIIRGTKNQNAAVDPSAPFMAALNSVQNTAWEINDDIFQVFKALWATGSTEAGLPCREKAQPPPKPTGADAEDPILMRRWKRDFVRSEDKEAERRGQVVAYGRTAWMADRLLRESRFWYPMFSDFRGRVYPRTGFLQPQGSDLSRSLLRFANGEPIKNEVAANWLRVHLANCYGVDKVSFADRLLWVGKNESEILKCGNDPLDCRWWTTADAPWAFLAACIDYWRFKQDGFGYVSKIPVAMDGSNNGLQLYALLTGDASLALRTNVLPSDVPQDIYADVAARATLALRARAQRGDPVGLGVGFLLDEVFGGALPRKLVKRPVMTLPYGVTSFSSARYVVEEIRTACEKSRKTLPSGINHYAVMSAVSAAVWSEISGGVGSALECMDWIRGLAVKCVEAGKSFAWTSPSGFPADQAYEETKATVIKPLLGAQFKLRREVTLQHSTGKLCARKASLGAPPNFVHSLDAAIMSLTVNRCAAVGIKDFCVVHDSFGVPAGDAEFLAGAIREAIVDAFKDDPLKRLASDVESRIGESVEPFVRKNEFDVSEVLNSKYIFA